MCPPPCLGEISDCHCAELKGWEAGWSRKAQQPPSLFPSGRFRTGPSPLSAIRQGAVQIQYDTKFVFTEVNGDKFIWLVKQNQDKEKNILIAVETASIGKNISTKMVGENKREDVTLQYKFPEGGCTGLLSLQADPGPGYRS